MDYCSITMFRVMAVESTHLGHVHFLLQSSYCSVNYLWKALAESLETD